MRFPTTPGSPRRARTRITLVAAAATIALTGALATSTANADKDPGTGHPAGQDERIETAGGVAWFHHHGEILTVQDVRKDGMGVRAHLLEVGSKTVTDRGVSGGPERRNLSIYEGAKVQLTLCYIDKGGDTISCSQRQTAYA